MSPRPSDGDHGIALRNFCAALRQLQREAGGPAVRALDSDPTFGWRKSQIHDTLAGRISRPPQWDFVRQFVDRCRAHAHRTRRRPSGTTDPEWWRREHTHLVDLAARRRVGRAADPISPVRKTSLERPLTNQHLILRRLVTTPDRTRRQIAVITGDIRQVRCADVWVNSENTDMVMARVQESSISAIIRYGGAVRDAAGRVVSDVIAAELEAKVASLRPLAPGATIVTCAGELTRSNGVRHVIHTAAVHGEPGSGFQPVKAIARCLENALGEAERLDACRTILFPLLGAGTGGGDVEETARVLIHGAINYLRSVPVTNLSTILFLAYSDRELDACQKALDVDGLLPLPSELELLAPGPSERFREGGAGASQFTRG